MSGKFLTGPLVYMQQVNQKSERTMIETFNNKTMFSMQNFLNPFSTNVPFRDK